MDSRELQDRLIEQMSQKEVLGDQFRHVWVEKSVCPRECYFLLLFVYHLSDEYDQGDHMVISATRRRIAETLFEGCLDTICENINPKRRKRVNELKLPERLRSLVVNRML